MDHVVNFVKCLPKFTAYYHNLQMLRQVLQSFLVLINHLKHSKFYLKRISIQKKHYNSFQIYIFNNSFSIFKMANKLNSLRQHGNNCSRKSPSVVHSVSFVFDSPISSIIIIQILFTLYILISLLHCFFFICCSFVKHFKHLRFV